jgi:Na+-driven multidrug efflux pump
MTFPATVISLGAIVLVPLSPALIFGFGPLPQLGIAGGAVAVILYYAAGSVAFIFFLWSGRGVLRPALRPPPLSWTRIRDILAVGAAASLIATTTNVSIGLATGFAGRYGPAAVAGYGTGARLEYLLVPLVFGLGAPLAAMVGTSIGAGCRDRAVRVAWVGAAMAGAITEAIGLAGALAPEAWLGLYSQDPGVLSYGSRYLHLVGPFYGCFGFGFALYFAAQGTGRLVWALFAGAARLATVCILGLIAVHAGSVAGLFTALGLAMIVFGGINAIATATGAWLSHTKLARPLPEAVTEAR